MAQYKGVMVYCEIMGEKLRAIATEVLGCGRRLADDLGQELCAVLVGSDITNLAQEAIAFGASKVYVVDDPLLTDYETDSYVSVMAKVVKQAMPQILLFGQTSIGRDLAPRLAFRLGTAAALDCVEVAIDPESKLLLQTRPVYGGNAQGIFTCEFYPQITTVRAKTMSPLQREDMRQGEVIAIDAGLEPSAIRTKVLGRVAEAEEGIPLEDAEVVIAGGRGIGSAKGFRQLEELAEIMNGAVGASRPVCDSGWISSKALIGQTGKIVTPDLYIAVGISGALQHMAGCSGATNIIAINKDADANIFKEAHFGVVDDWKKVLPAFTDKLKEFLTD